MLVANLSYLHIDPLRFGQHFSFFSLLMHSKRGQCCPHLCSTLWMFSEKIGTVDCAFYLCERQQFCLNSALDIELAHLKVSYSLVPGPIRLLACIAEELSVHNLGLAHSIPKSFSSNSRTKMVSLAVRDTPRSSASREEVAGRPGWVWVVTCTIAP